MDKTLVIVGGANGVGKTTFAIRLKEEYGIDYLGADDLANKFKEKGESHVDIKAGKEFFRLLDSYLIEKKSLIIESTLSGVALY